MRQLPLPFVHRPDYEPAEFLHGPGSVAASTWLAAPETWPEARLALWGTAGSGKTHLLHVWAKATSATLLHGLSLDWPMRLPGEGALGVDDAHEADETALLHVLNAAQEARRAVVLAARLPPTRWLINLPDLGSRLRATTAVEVHGAEDELLGALFARLLAERQLVVPASVQAWLLLRLPRTPSALSEAASHLDAALLACGGRINRALAERVVDAVVRLWQGAAA